MLSAIEIVCVERRSVDRLVATSTAIGAQSAASNREIIITLSVAPAVGSEACVHPKTLIDDGSPSGELFAVVISIDLRIWLEANPATMPLPTLSVFW